MYLQIIDNILQSHKVKIKYDCNGGFEKCGQESLMKLKDAEKNLKNNEGKHICRQCYLKDKNPMKKKENVEKLKNTFEEKYGGMPMNSKEQIDKRREKFKDQEFVKQRTEKRKITNLSKYGTEYAQQCDSVKEKQKNTMQERYGVDHPYQSKEILEKMKSNNKEKYGVENLASLKEVQIKMAKTTFEKYGVEHYNQLPCMKEYLAENCKEWLKESWKNPWAKGIKRPEEWNQKQREAITKLIISGNWSGGFKSNIKGRFPAWKCKKENPRFLSSLELKLHYFLNINPIVKEYDYEGISIEYFKSDGTKHLYFPDFQINYIDDEIIHILETKTWKNKDNLDVKSKQDAAIEYCNKNNMVYTILFDEDVDELVGLTTQQIIEKTPNLILF